MTPKSRECPTSLKVSEMTEPTSPRITVTPMTATITTVTTMTAITMTGTMTGDQEIVILDNQRIMKSRTTKIVSATVTTTKF